MKKLLLLTLFIFICMPGASARQMTTLPDILITSGTITEVMPDGAIRLEGEGAYKKIILNNIDSAYILDGDKGEAVSKELLKVGTKITAYYPPRLTRSIPPHGQPVAIIIGEPLESARYFKIGQVDISERGVRLLNTNKTQFVTVTTDVMPYPEQLKSQKEVLVWYKISTLSMPGQAFATKAKSIFKERPDIYAHLTAGVASVNCNEVQLNGYVDKASNTLYLPVESIAKASGWEYAYDQNTNEASLNKAGKSVKFYLGNFDYTVNGESYTMKNSIYRLYGEVFAPIDLFMDGLGMSVVAVEEHI